MNRAVVDYRQALTSLGIGHEVFTHPYLVSPEEVQKYLGKTVADCVASLVMKADDHFILILKKGDDRLDFKKIKKALKISDLRFATKEEFEKLTGLPFGAARPYIPNLPTYIDPAVFSREFLNGGTGSFTETFRYRTADLKKIPGASVLEACQNP